MTKFVKSLKGGSLSHTFVVERRGALYVRKQCNNVKDRERGFLKLFSQKNKQNYLNKIFPNYFLPVISCGLDGENAFIELEYLEDYKNLYEVLSADSLNEEDIHKIYKKVIELLTAMRRTTLCSKFNKSSLLLYLHEEFLRPIELVKNSQFHALFKERIIKFEGESVSNLIYQNISEIYSLDLNKCFTNETMSHGNLTFENILISSDYSKLKLIDVYDENYFSTIYNDISQLLQCSLGLYSSTVNQQKIIEDDQIYADFSRSFGVDKFNLYLMDYISKNFCVEEIKLINLFFISQFTRMLPYKLGAKDFEGAAYYFWKASKLYEDIFGCETT